MRPPSSFRPTIAALGIVVAGACSGGSRPAADLVVTNARIWTNDPGQPEAQALAIVGERIVDVGPAARIDTWRGDATQVVDAEGRRVVPGFNDAHVHIVDAGIAIEQIDLRDARDAAEIVRRIGERARGSPGDWIVGGRWTADLAAAQLPTRAEIDDVTNGSPVFVVDVDRRRALVNSAAFGRAGVTEQTADPAGGRIVRDARGLPTGLVEGDALAIFDRVVPRPAPADRVRIVKHALERAASLGVTSLQDVGATGEDVGAFADLAGRGELTARIYVIANESGWYDQAKLGIRRAFGSPWLRLGAVAGAADEAPDPHALDLLRTRLMAADHSGLQVCMLATGPGGIARSLDRLDDIIRADGPRDRRFRVERAQRADAEDARRFADMQAVASLQPGDSAPDAFAAMQAAHARIALGSGWPADTLDPIHMLQIVARRATVADAIAAHTLGSAFAEFQDTEKGRLARGRLADLVVLSDDVFAAPADRLPGVKVLTTIAGGKVVHQRRP